MDATAVRRARSLTLPHSPSKTGVNALFLGRVDRRRRSGWGSRDEINLATPTPNPSPQGGGEFTEFVVDRYGSKFLFSGQLSRLYTGFFRNSSAL